MPSDAAQIPQAGENDLTITDSLRGVFRAAPEKGKAGIRRFFVHMPVPLPLAAVKKTAGSQKKYILIKNKLCQRVEEEFSAALQKFRGVAEAEKVVSVGVGPGESVFQQGFSF